MNWKSNNKSKLIPNNNFMTSAIDLPENMRLINI